MVDKSIIRAKIAIVTDCLNRLKEKKWVSRELFLKDRDVQDIVLHNLQIAIQASTDIASHIVSDNDWPIPGTVMGLFDILEENKVITKKTSETLKKMAGFRNVIVHEYEGIDLNKVYDITKNRLSDFTTYLKQIIKRTKL